MAEGRPVCCGGSFDAGPRSAEKPLASILRVDTGPRVRDFRRPF